MKKSFLFLNFVNRQGNMLALFVTAMLCLASVMATAQVSNNNCANAIPLSCGDTVSGSTTNATHDGPTIDCAGQWGR